MENKNFFRLLCFVILVCLTTTAFSQTKTISGTVTDEKGDPVSAASVVEETSKTGTSTLENGTFSIAVPAAATSLTVSSVGFEDQQINITNTTTITVKLVESAKTDLNEVVVIGYGTVRKRDLTGSVVSLQSKDFNKGITTAPDQLIQGKTPGVQVINNTGQPGGATTVRIRGNSSIRAGNNPLFVLDGIPLSGNSTVPGGSAGFATDQGNPLTYLNPNDIASMDILKDASATAIYGSRGANGVVIINTKKGISGEPTLNIMASTGISNLLKKPKVLSADQFREAVQFYTPNDAANVDFGGDVDAFDAITQRGIVQNYAAAVTGGTESGRYRLSAGYMDQSGIIKNSGLKKFTANFSSSFKFLESKKLGLDFNVLVTQVNNRYAPIDVGVGFTGNLISQALVWNPTRPLRGNNDSLTYINPNYRNPLATLDAYKDLNVQNTIVASIAPSYKITKDLDYKLTYSVTRQIGRRTGSFNAGLIDPNNVNNGFGFIRNTTQTDQQVTNTLNYSKQLSNALNLNAVAGHEYLNYDSRENFESGTGFTNVGLDFFDYLGYSVASTRGVGSFRSPKNELQSFFARAALNFEDKYLFTGTIRRDGSTKFGENNKYANFPSVAVAWNITNEPFLKNNGIVNNLKLRLGWGKTGNQEFPSGASRNRYVFDLQSIRQANYGNPDLKWESSATVNAGIDFAFFKNRLYGSLDYFRKKTTDALFEQTLAQPAPAGRLWVNLDGSIINRGFELALTGTIIQNNDWNWNVSANATSLKNTVSGLPGYYETAQLRGQGFSGVVGQRMVNDQPLNVWYLAIFEGIDPATGLSMYRALDGTVGNSLVVDPALNKFYVKSPNPRYLLGTSTELTYKKFSLGINMNGAFGHYLFNNTFATVLGINNLSGRNMAQTYFNTAIKESVSNSAAPSTRYLEKGDYMKLSNATLSYRIGNIGTVIRNLNVTVTGQNLFILTGYKGFDPEVNTDGGNDGIPSLGIEYLPYPSARSFLLGVNFSL